MKLKRWFQASFWVFVYLVLTLAPVLLLLFTERPAGREFWRDFSVALGFCGIAMMALQFVLTARFKTLKSPYGSDIVYFFHKRISLITFALILAHPILLFVFSPDLLRLLNPFDPQTPWRARFAVAAVLGLFGLIGLSIWRKKLRLEYTRWRIWHGILAVLAVVLAAAHMYGVGYYINTPAKQILWFLYIFVWVWLLLWVRVIKPFMLLRKPFEVVSVSPERGNAWSVTLRPKGHDGFKFQPGQFAWITAWASPFADAEHPFSISSSSEKAPELVFTIKRLGDFTARIKELQPGQVVYVDGPYGSFSMDRHAHAKGVVFLAGGVGITPMMSMLRSMADRGDKRPALLIYANNDLENVTFREEIEELKSRLNLKVVHVLRHPPAGWQGESGYVTKATLQRHLPSERTRNTYEMFICGPQPMMDAMEKALAELGVYVGDFHSEQFNFV
jgi:predicted ferric reductase